MISAWKALNRPQRAAFLASLMGWTLDAFDYFLLVFVVRSIAADFHTQVKEVAYAITLTLMMRPVGALLFGWLADRFGRRPVLMIDVILYSLIELASAFAPSLPALLILRGLFGIAMGGEWGIGSSLVMESVPPQTRGALSGLLQEGYAFGYLIAAAVYGLFFGVLGWRGMFAVGVIPAVLALYIRLGVKESPAWEKTRERRAAAGGQLAQFFGSLKSHAGLLVYLIVLMTAFNFFSHGTQDLYPTFLQGQRHLSEHRVSELAIVANLGAIVGGMFFGSWSQRVGRRKAIVVASLLALPVIPLWAFAGTTLLLGLGAFLIQFAVQGAWGVIPAHLNELSPDEIRGTFPGFAYQLGNLFASVNAVLQATYAQRHGYAAALALIAGITAVAIVLVSAWGPEARTAVLGGGAEA